MELEVFILAGGKSRRMGTDKGIISFNGKAMVQYSIDKANQLSDRVTIISNNLAYKEFGVSVVKDIVPNIGPIGGVYTCLLYTSDAADDSLRVDLGGRRIIKKMSVIWMR